MRGFGELEAAIMDRAWSSGGPLLMRDIQQALTPARAYNTVLTVVEILYRKGWLPREKDGRPTGTGDGQPGRLHRGPDG